MPRCYWSLTVPVIETDILASPPNSANGIEPLRHSENVARIVFFWVVCTILIEKRMGIYLLDFRVFDHASFVGHSTLGRIGANDREVLEPGVAGCGLESSSPLG